MFTDTLAKSSLATTAAVLTARSPAMESEREIVIFIMQKLLLMPVLMMGCLAGWLAGRGRSTAKS